MDHQLELGYLVVEVPEPDILTPTFADVVGLVPGEPHAEGLADLRFGSFAAPHPHLVQLAV